MANPGSAIGADGLPAALPSNLYRYVWQASGWHQLPLVALTICVSLLEVFVPLELQRRIVDDAVKNRNYRFVLILCAVYLGMVAAAGRRKACPQRLPQLGRRERRPRAAPAGSMSWSTQRRRRLPARSRGYPSFDDRRRGRAGGRVCRRQRFRTAVASRHPVFGAGLHAPRRPQDGRRRDPVLHPAADFCADDAARDEPPGPVCARPARSGGSASA